MWKILTLLTDQWVSKVFQFGFKATHKTLYNIFETNRLNFIGEDL